MRDKIVYVILALFCLIGACMSAVGLLGAIDQKSLSGTMINLCFLVLNVWMFTRTVRNFRASVR